MRLLYAREAIDDLDHLRTFIAANAPEAAQRIVEALIERMERLAEFPGIGRAVRESPSALDVREFVFGDHIVRYVVTTDAVIVLRLWHHLESRRR